MADGALWSAQAQRIGGHSIITGDCIAAMGTQVAAASVDVVVTSPPYNLSLAYSLYDDARSEADYLAWLLAAAARIRTVLKPDGSFFLNIAGSNSRPWIPFELIVRLRAAGFHLQNHIAWVKSITVENESSGHFKPVPGRRFMHHNHEHIFHLTLDNAVVLDRLSIGIPFQDKSNIARRGHPRDLRCRGNTWFIPYPTVKTKAQKFWHPGTFPVELPLWCIYLHGRRDAVVLDPFLGTGTTLVAAHYAGARGIGIDLDPHYVQTACQRLTEAVAATRLVTLDAAEVAALSSQDAGRGGAGWQARLTALQQRLNKTTGTLPLSSDDVAWLRRHAVPGQGGWQQALHAAFARHLRVLGPSGAPRAGDPRVTGQLLLA